MTAHARAFPDGFLWGTATASFQIEGATTEGGRSRSIWDTFCEQDGKVANKDTGDPACDHYHRYPEDVAIMGELGVGAYRFSVAWPRVIPTGTGTVNPEGIDFYSRLVDLLLDKGIRPVATLYHWDLPQALDDRGGWTARDSTEWYTEYVAATVGALGDRVKNWTTFNEPWCSSYLSYALGVHAPGHTDQGEACTVAHHLLLSHGRAVPVIRGSCPDAEVSITLNPSQVIGPDEPTDADRDAIRRLDNVYNGAFLDPLFRSRYPEGFLDDTAHLGWQDAIHDGDLETIATPIDNLGINNYFPVRGASSGDDSNGPGLPGCEGVAEVAPQGPLTAMGWEQNAAAHREIVERCARDSGLPVYITENGSAWEDEVDDDGRVHDPDRVAYLRDHLTALADSVEAGTDIRGYFAWSLLDNFEWSYGYGKRFGIVHVDYDTQVRTIKDSGREYARIVAANAV